MSADLRAAPPEWRFRETPAGTIADFKRGSLEAFVWDCNGARSLWEVKRGGYRLGAGGFDRTDPNHFDSALKRAAEAFRQFEAVAGGIEEINTP